MLCDLAYFWESNGIRYDLTGGSALGAIRYDGFISWDDDIEIGIPHPDYIRFMEIADRLPERYSISNLFYNTDNIHAYFYDSRRHRWSI